MWIVKIHDKNKEDQLLKNGVDILTSRLLSQRNVDICKYKEFLNYDYRKLSFPYTLNCIEKSVDIFCKHAKLGSCIGIVGDFDCDGLISSTMIIELCKTFNLKYKVFIPSRFEHGYGLNESSLKAIKTTFKTPPQLIFALDCGTNSKAEIKELKKWGVKDIIVIDHHLPGKANEIAKNASSLINWHISDTNELCTCGSVFQFIRGIRWVTKKVNPIEYLSYAAIGTIADSSPIIGDNRIIVKNGLGDYAMSFMKSSGIRAIMNVSNIHSSYLTQEDVAFKIAPRINSVGRLQDASIALKLLTECDAEIAEKLAKEINELNSQRKELHGFVEGDAMKAAYSSKATHGILIYNENWHIGVVGIVSSRVSEELKKPSLIVGKYKGKWKGSGRTEGFTNVKEVLDLCSFMFERYGGHFGAVGFTLKDEYIEKAPEIFDNATREYWSTRNLPDRNRYFDITLKTHAVNPTSALLLLNNLYPYCKEHNNEPIFRLKNVLLQDVELREGKGWRLLTFRVSSIDMVVPYEFKLFSPKFGTEIDGRKCDIYFTFPQKWNSEDYFGKFNLHVVDMELK